MKCFENIFETLDYTLGEKTEEIKRLGWFLQDKNDEIKKLKKENEELKKKLQDKKEVLKPR